MGSIAIRVDGRGLLNYANAGKDAAREVTKTVRTIMNLGRKTVRQRIAREFQVRKGNLKKHAQKIQTKAIVKQAEVRGIAAPLPMLLNIFEGGATLAKGRGYLRPRPAIIPAKLAMEKQAPTEFTRILQRVGR